MFGVCFGGFDVLDVLFPMLKTASSPELSFGVARWSEIRFRDVGAIGADPEVKSVR